MEAFTLLKKALTVVLLLRHFEYKWEIRVKTNAFNNVFAGVLL